MGKWLEIDEKYKNHRRQYIIQSLMVVGVIAFVMTVMDIFSQGITVASIGASATIAFARPHTETARSKYLIGSYSFAVLIAWGCTLLMNFSLGIFPSLKEDTSLIIFGSLVVGLTVFITVITETEHPPASALALGLLMNGITLSNAAEAIVAISIVAAMRRIFQKHMMDLY